METFEVNAPMQLPRTTNLISNGLNPGDNIIQKSRLGRLDLKLYSSGS